MVDLEIASALTFFAIMGLLILKDRKNIEFNYGLIIKRWTRGKELIDKLVNRSRKVLPLVGNIGIVIGIIASIAGLVLLAISIYLRLPGTAPVLPSIGGYSVPGTFGIPFWYWIAAIFPLLFIHESFHAIFSRLENVKIKNYGILLFLVIPFGAFVDPDENGIKKLSLKKKVRIFSAGSLGNFFLVLIVIFILFLTNLVLSQITESIGVKFSNTIPGTPADAVGLNGTIYEINNTKISDVGDLTSFLSKTPPGTSIVVYTTTGQYSLNTSNNPDNGNISYLGINRSSNVLKFKVVSEDPVPDSFVRSTIIWFNFLEISFILNFGVAIFNMLPMLPFDGGLVFKEIFTKYFGEALGNKAITFSSLVSLFLILFSFYITITSGFKFPILP